jgi:hypothetical protein
LRRRSRRRSLGCWASSAQADLAFLLSWSLGRASWGSVGEFVSRHDARLRLVVVADDSRG